MLLSIVQVILIGVVIYLSNSKIIIDSEKSHLDQLINTVNQDLESRMEAFNSDALNIVIRDEIKQNLNLDTDLEIGIAKRDIVTYLSSRTISTNGYLDISIIDMEANTYSVRATYYLPAGFNIEDMEVFNEAQKYNGGLVWLSENDLNELYAKDSILLKPLGGISGAAVIKDYSSNEIKGLLVLVIKDNYFRNMQYSNQNLENVLLYLISPDKSIIIPMNSSENEIEENILKQIDGQEKRGSFTSEKTNYTDEYLVSYIKNNAMGWYLVSVSTASSLTATFNQTASILLFTLAVSLLACFFLASGISGYVTKGMRSLADKMRKVGQGDFNAKINTGRIDEIGELSNVFDNMVENTKSLIQQKYEQELLKKEAEYRALQAQINPHFLHNTLDMINWRLIDKGEEEISQSIVALGNLLRYSAENDSPNAHINEEINNVKDYLFLRHANSNKMFEYEMKVDDKMDIIIPKLTLQPIVENSLIHGFAGRKRGNKIQINGSITKEGHIIEISDNGIGMTKEEIKIIKNLKSQKPSNEKSHIGLKNVEARIKHMYKDAKLEIMSQYGFGTTIRIIIPKDIG